MKYGVIGEKLGHSFSKEIHERLGKYEYEIKEIPADELESFIISRDFDGINVTIPYKERVIPYLDEVSGLAEKVGAVNTIVNKDGKLYGYNTDVGGMRMLAERMGVNMRGKTVLIAGSGGTSKTALQVAREMGADNVLRVSRSAKDGCISYEEAYADYKNADVLINTTPVGMFPNVDGSAFDLARFENVKAVIDAVYNPLESKLIRNAKERGMVAAGGLYMLVAQAALAAGYFCGEEIGSEKIDEIFDEILKEKRNIVLIGMPGCGKTSIGRLLADRLGKEFIDTDDEIVKEAGCEISKIFNDQGEKYFRDLESDIIRRAALYNGRVIATGGGAVLRKENVDMLRLNGIIVLLDRTLDELMPTSDRPLADDADKMRRLYEERMPVYRSSADITVAPEGFEDLAAEMVQGALR